MSKKNIAREKISVLLDTTPSEAQEYFVEVQNYLNPTPPLVIIQKWLQKYIDQYSNSKICALDLAGFIMQQDLGFQPRFPAVRIAILLDISIEGANKFYIDILKHLNFSPSIVDVLNYLEQYLKNQLNDITLKKFANFINRQNPHIAKLKRPNKPSKGKGKKTKSTRRKMSRPKEILRAREKVTFSDTLVKRISDFFACDIKEVTRFLNGLIMMDSRFGKLDDQQLFAVIKKSAKQKTLASIDIDDAISVARKIIYGYNPDYVQIIYVPAGGKSKY